MRNPVVRTIPQAVNNGDPSEIRTLDTRLRRPLLYPAELQAHVIIAEQYKKYGADDGNRTRIISLEG